MDGASSISVAVRVRPFSEKERLALSSTYNVGPTLFQSDSSSSSTSHTTPQPPRVLSSSGGGSGNTYGSTRKVLKVLDDRILVFDPPETNAVVNFNKSANAGGGGGPPMMGKKVKDIRFCFDRVFDEDCGQEEVYDGSAKELVGHVMEGFHSTVFAYGATGCGKTHTISGSQSQPGIVFLIMKDLFSRISSKSDSTDFNLTVSYLEIYNETIRDLLNPDSGPLQLRESNGTATPANLSTKEPSSASDVVEWITLGNQNRTVNATEANATSSRSHAVLRVTVTQKLKAGGLTDTSSSATLSVIDLAGSERASVTKNKGDRLIEGANINRSLLALGNCINALCDPRKRGHVPYRDSKLTRLLKQSLGGNCKTVMIVCVSPSSSHYDETHNTLQYANRAKEIKTKAIRNVVSVDRHVAQYCQQIMEQSRRIEELKSLVERLEAGGNGGGVGGIGGVEEDQKVVKATMMKLSSCWENGRRKLVEVERAMVEKGLLDDIISILQRWYSTTFSSSLDSSIITSSTTIVLIQSNYSQLLSSLSQSSSSLSNLINSSSSTGSPLDMYTTMLTSLTSSLRSTRPSSLSLLSLETRLLDSKLSTSLSEARELGTKEGMKVLVRVMEAMNEARAKVGGAVEKNEGEEEEEEEEEEVKGLMKKFEERVERANKEAFAAFISTTTTSGGGGGAGTTTTGTHKRDAGTISPLIHEDIWSSKHVRTTSPHHSLPPPPPPAPATFRRSSPRKGVAFRPPSSSSSRSFAASPKKARKEVQWKDETGDGWELEETRHLTPPSASSTSTSATPSVRVWTASSTNTRGPSASAAEMMALKARSSLVGVGGLRNKASGTLGGGGGARRLPRVEEGGGGGAEQANFFVRDAVGNSSVDSSSSFEGGGGGGGGGGGAAIGSTSTRSPFLDVGNTSTSFSMAPSSSGLFAPLLPSTSTSTTHKPTSLTSLTSPNKPRLNPPRRLSSIGPLRSSKPNRRTSYIIPPTPTIPRSAQKSPRKLTSSTTSTARRLSSVPPPSYAGFGAKSAARIAKRRESSAVAGGGGGGGGGGFMAPTTASLMAQTVRKDSPTSSSSSSNVGGTGSGVGGWR